MKKNKLIFITKPGMISARQEDISWRHIENDVFYYGMGISHFIAENFIRKKLNFDIEIWRTDEKIKTKVERKVKGFLGKVYPYRELFNFPYSFQFIRDLKKQAKEYNLIIWFDGTRSLFYMFVSFFLRNTPMVAHLTGGANFKYKYKKTKKIKYYLAYLLERLTFAKYLDLAILGADGEFENFSNSRILKQYTVGLDFNNIWKITDKVKAREQLGLPLDKKIILQMGRAYSFKGTQITVNAWLKHLKQKGILLYLTGIHETDEHYELVKNSGCNFRGFINDDDVPLWHVAADVYVYPPFDEITLAFAGVGNAPFEALACGTPIVCTTARFLQFFNIKKEEYNNIAKIPETEDEVAQQIEEFIAKPPSPQMCRNFVYKYYNNDYLYNKMYDELFAIAPLHFMPKKK